MPTQNHLMIDDQTLRDLDVFSAAHGGAGLFGRIDTTRTRRGRQALYARIKHPLANADDIRLVQGALAHLGRSTTPFPLDNEAMTAVDAYLRARIEIPPWTSPGAKLSAIAAALRNRDIQQELANGTRATVRFVDRFQAYCAELRSSDPGPYLRDLLDPAIAAADELATQGVTGRAPRSLRAVLHHDTVLRKQCREPLRRLVDTAAELDALDSMAAYGLSAGFAIPEMTSEGPLLIATDLVHPLLEDPVGNPVSLTGAANVIYLTGPNMAGKTTYIKATSLALILAQTGMRVPAKHLHFSPFDCLFTGINTTDDLSAGVSYYLAEVRRIKDGARHLAAGTRSLMLFDEAFKGTNVFDASEATRLVVESCADVAHSAFVFSSHLSELADGLQAKGISQKFFSGSICDAAPRYDYALRDGPSAERTGLHLLKTEGVLDLMHDAARGN